MRLGSAMRKDYLFCNPNSGGRCWRQAEVESVVALLRRADVEAELVLTDSPAEAEQQARQAVQSGCDTVFACGGDGTIHTILQVLANTSVALAILPMGTANALAHDLGLPMNLKGAGLAALHGMPRRVALGRIQYLELHGKPGARLFVGAAGAGGHSHLFYHLPTTTNTPTAIHPSTCNASHICLTHP